MDGNMVVPGEVRLGLGGMVLAFVPAAPELAVDVDEQQCPFISQAPSDVTLSILPGPAPWADLGPPLFDSGWNWAMHRVGEKPVIRIRIASHDPHQVVVLEPDLRRGEIYCVGELWSRHDKRPSPLAYPLVEVLIINLLARYGGILLHASAVRDGERAYLFCGNSGAGKSTMASLWERGQGSTVLSDDRVIVRERDGRFWAYGTPWHGDARLASPEAMPLDGIFAIHHAQENRAVPLKPLDAAARLLARAFPTFWDSTAMGSTLDFLGRLCQAVPCYDLGFVPDDQVVDFVRHNISG